MEQVQQGATFFIWHMGAALDGSKESNAAVQRELETYASLRHERLAGMVISARIYDPSGTLLAKWDDNQYAPISAVTDWLDSPPFVIPAGTEGQWEVLQIEGHPHVKVLVPISGHEHSVPAWCAAVLRISESAIAEFQYRILRSVLIIIGVILATTALLYPVIIRLINKLSAFSVNLLDANLEVIKVLGSAIAKKDSDTDAHNYRVTLMAVQLAEAVKLDTESIRALIKGAFLHDVGKIGIPDAVLLKPGKLDAQEFSIMKLHVDHGLEIIRKSDWLADAATVIGGHHEKYNGSGYPDGLAQGNVPILARIFCIVDVFDALTCRRPYKDPFSYDDAMQILNEGKGTHFDPWLLDQFRQLSEMFYQKIAMREDADLRDELNEIIRKYFAVHIGEFM